MSCFLATAPASPRRRSNNGWRPARGEAIARLTTKRGPSGIGMGLF